MSFKTIPFYQKFPLNIREDSLYYYNENGVMYGHIGNTHCCGSAATYGLSLCASKILGFLKEARVSILLLNVKLTYWDNTTLISITDAINKHMPDVFQVKGMKLSAEQYLFILDIKDRLAYFKWLGGK